MEPWIQYVVAVMSTVTAAGAIGTCSFAAAIWRLARKHERALYGEDDNPEYNGVVPKVARMESALEREGIL